LHYGLLAARAEILKAGESNDYSNCMLDGYHGMAAFFCFNLPSPTP
jgi:apyrase